jgi:hypothetical protein
MAFLEKTRQDGLSTVHTVIDQWPLDSENLFKPVHTANECSLKSANKFTWPLYLVACMHVIFQFTFQFIYAAHFGIDL